MADEQLRKSQLIEYENIAGHDGMQSTKSGRVIVKPCQQPEIDFYQSTMEHPEFRHFIPLFLGTLELNQVAEPKVSHSRAPSQNLLVPGSDQGQATPWTPSGGGKISADHGIVLENVAYGFTKPNILDVKLGRRLWADDAPPAKRLKLDKIASETTSQPLGFRIAGMKTFVGYASSKADNIDGYRKYDKSYGRTLSTQTVHHAFEDYFFIESAGITKELGVRVIRRFLDDLRALQQVLEAEESRMYSSSLLFVYEGDSERLRHDLDTPTPAVTHSGSSTGGSVDFDTLEDVKIENGHDEQATFTQGQFTIVQTTFDANLGSTEDVASNDSDVFAYKVQAIKMIDFAHATWVPGQGSDENTLFGIKNVIRILEEMIS